MNGANLAFKLKADYLKALSHPMRLLIIENLKKGEKSVGQLVNACSVEQSSVSKNLAILRQAGIVSSRQEKVTVYYSIRDKSIFNVLRTVADLLHKKLKESEKIMAHLARK